MDNTLLLVLLLTFSFYTALASKVPFPCNETQQACSVIPTEIPHGTVTQITDGYGQVALGFQCDPHFILVGKQILTCCGDVWEEAFPRCYAKECQAHFLSGKTTDGEFIISPDGISKVPVYCDMTNGGGGWTVIQRRRDGSTNFYRSYDEYKKGFGHHCGNFWIGLNVIHEITQQDCELYAYMEAGAKESAYARYSAFRVAGEADNYRLTLTGYSGTAGDCTNSGSSHNGKPFTTFDADHDDYGSNCAVLYKGGWWYDKCHACNPNGLYLNGSHPNYAEGIDWRSYRGYHYSMTYMELKVRCKYHNTYTQISLSP